MSIPNDWIYDTLMELRCMGIFQPQVELGTKWFYDEPTMGAEEGVLSEDTDM